MRKKVFEKSFKYSAQENLGRMRKWWLGLGFSQEPILGYARTLMGQGAWGRDRGPFLSGWYEQGPPKEVWVPCLQALDHAKRVLLNT